MWLAWGNGARRWALFEGRRIDWEARIDAAPPHGYRAPMKLFRFFWDTHRWTGITIGLVLLLVAGTGFLLLLKKEYASLQPPTRRGASSEFETFGKLQESWKSVLALKRPEFRSTDDIDRIDVRPGKGTYKFRSKRDDYEVQVCATTGAILSQATRRSDFIERLHDGSWISGSFKTYVMPLVALGLIYLAFTGYTIWLMPKWRRRKKRIAHAEKSRSNSN